MEWQPIETAQPWDEILVGVWVDFEFRQWVAFDEFGTLEWGNDGEFGDPPTHWMPLPEPPTRETGK